MMHGLRRSMVSIAPRVANGLKNKSNVMGTVLSRSLVDLSTKEQGEELTYIRRLENQKKQELREKMEAILAREQNDKDKQALISMIESNEKKVDPRDVGILQYLGFDDWRWAMPMSMMFAFPMIAHEVILIDYKFYLVGVFCLMWHTYDYVVMPIWSEKTDWITEYLRDFWIDIDNQAVAEIEAGIKANEGFADAQSVFADIFKGVDEVAVAQAHALNLTHRNDLHRSIQKKLDALASLNEATNAAIRTDMLSTVKTDAMNAIKDTKVKDAALAQAIATLAAGPKGTRGADVVGKVYAKAIADYRAGLAAKDHKVHDISKKLEAEIAEICKPPEVIAQAGNVYDTHPVLQR
ncbi:unnamed protein product [Symbiodinium microadriaticum]|nr:unnamed protein product [Symbiodinium microadriaticum]